MTRGEMGHGQKWQSRGHELRMEINVTTQSLMPTHENVISIQLISTQ